ncbi:hypothetical protein LC612_22765 [Nostoc sp. CHAB 5834]|nr:hypothetical protein [Nostoc sp. CHAB 5834]
MELDKTSLIPHQHQSEIKEKEKKMKVNQQEQLLTELNPLLEEISDDNSASLTGGVTRPFRVTPENKLTGVYRTIPDKISTIKITLNRAEDSDIIVSALRARNNSEFAEGRIRRGELSATIATNVLDRTNFRLRFSAPLRVGTISGQVEY